MHRDIEVIHEIQGLLDGLVIPAHILAYQDASTASFVCSLPRHDYVIDPMTYMFQNPRGGHIRDDGSLRPSIKKWCDRIHPDFESLITKPGKASAPIEVAEFPDYKELCSELLKFQIESVSDAHIDPRAKKYLGRYGTTIATKPRCILPPYFAFSAIDDEWYKLSVVLAHTMKSLVGDEHEVAPIILCDPSILTEPAIRKIVADFGPFDRCFLWMDNVNQASTEAATILRIRRLVSELQQASCKVEAMFGGYMMMMMMADGLESVSHGILYTQHKASRAIPGGGGVPERYYIQKFHDFRSLAQANLILKRFPELIGNTATAKSVMGSDADKIFLFTRDPDLLRKHFLEARQIEANEISSRPMPDLVSELRTTHEEYHSAVSSLPNPDAVLTSSDMKGLDYLIEWADAFT